ncbi:MAG: vitamin B12 dependent-methionine synthase activation domain-containing protein [Candidatus Caldatribacteriota bacterium]|nr:vitamin B12 dependent-methionine synthase activation domain-containing protein [Candidatus Caldatribacteriota bacterium]
MKIIKDIKLKIDKDEVLRYQGYNKRKVIKPKKIILQIIEEEIERACNLYKPQGIYDSFKIKSMSFSKKRVDLENHFSFSFNNSVTDFLKGADYLVLGVVTIGDILEDKISEYFNRKEYPRGLALDTIGTVAVRYLSQYVISIICRESKEKNLQTTKRFTPGTAEWDISEQKYIFEMIPAYKIGVELTNSFMMTPQKSLSWAIGVGKNILRLSKDDNSCRICQAIDCQYRQIYK